MPIRTRALHGALLLVGGLLVASPGEGIAQAVASVRVDENFRREPNGLILARLNAGTNLRVLDTEGSWSQVDLRGWVWLPSLQVSADPDLQLVVAASGGENIRARASGDVLGRLVEGALLAELERVPSWARVSRVGWIWSASLEDVDGVAASDSSGDAPTRAPEDVPTRTPDAVAPEGRSAGADPVARTPSGYVRTGGGPILAAPDGDTLAVARPSGDVEIVRREGNWARVRLEGWMWMPSGREQPSDTAVAETPTAIEPADLAMNPDGHAGRVVEWSLRFISLERAEAVRTDFFEGEPFILARFGGGDGPFVYVAVPPDRVAEVQGLVPLERIEVTGRVRTGASALTNVPIIDLIGIERSRDAP